jgi:hypothetical protein
MTRATAGGHGSGAAVQAARAAADDVDKLRPFL